MNAYRRLMTELREHHIKVYTKLLPMGLEEGRVYLNGLTGCDVKKTDLLEDGFIVWLKAFEQKRRKS